MKKRTLIIWTCIMVVLAIGLGICAYFVFGDRSGGKSKDTEEGVIDTDFQSATIYGAVLDTVVRDEDSALAAASEMATLLGYSEDQVEFAFERFDTSGELTYARMVQTYEGIPVYGSLMVLVIDAEGAVQAVSTNLSGKAAEIESIEPTVDEEMVVAAIQAYSGTENVSLMVESFSRDLLTIHVSDGKAVLAYETAVNLDGSPYTYVVDAASGDVISALSNTYYYQVVTSGGSYNAYVYDANETLTDVKQVNEFADSNGNVYQFTGVWRDSNGERVYIKGNQIYNSDSKVVGTVNQNLIQFYPHDEADQLNSDCNSEAKAVVLDYYVEQIYEFYMNLFNRYGFDGENGRVNIVFDTYFIINGMTDTGNACASALFGYPDAVLRFGYTNAIPVDTFAHEYMHSVENTISGMKYQGESGAIMEGVSDIFGELFEEWYGDELWNSQCDWIHDDRNIKDPNNVKLPSKYNDKYWKDTTSSSDHGNVHHNSTVISHLAYLLVEGEGNTLTYEELAKLIYNTLFVLPRDCNFEQFTNNLIATARAMQLSDSKIEHIYQCVRAVGLDPNKVEDVYSVDAKVQVYHLYSEPTSEFTLLIEGTTAAGRKVSKTITTETESPVDLGLKAGVYTLTVRSNEDAEKTWVQNVRLAYGVERDLIEFYTTIPAPADTEGTTDYVVQDGFKLKNGFVKAVDQVSEVPEGYVGIYTFEDFKVIADHCPSDGDITTFNIPVNEYNSARYILMNDISLPENYDSALIFAGVLDGNGYTIHNIDKPLFIYLMGAKIKNLGVDVDYELIDDELKEDITFGPISNWCFVGIGSVNPEYYSSIDNCYARGTINMDTRYKSGSVGGLMADAQYCEITNSYNDTDITVKDRWGADCGGIAGVGSNATNCYNTGNIYVHCTDGSMGGGTINVGGIFGRDGNMSYCYNAGNLSADYLHHASIFVGGIIGSSDYSMELLQCYNMGNITATSAYEGEYAEENEKEEGDFRDFGNPQYFAGGIAGIQRSGWNYSCDIIRCWNKGKILGKSTAGGIVGVNSGEFVQIVDCYNTGITDAKYYCGGIIGYIASTSDEQIVNCYNSGGFGNQYVTSYKGMIAGAVHADIQPFSNCYYLNNGFNATSDGRGEAGTTALSMSAMEKSQSYIGYDFVKVWTMSKQYPVLLKMKSPY
ncbi:MAG: M4 family metallopeptidase [Clostridia bacterium]|nr:M4 family metallopeptidase [Clostridia bacterium]